MSHLRDAVGPDEFILRRIHKNHFNPGLPRTINFAAFRPKQADTAGWSVYREKYISPAEVAATGRKPGEYCVVRLPVHSLSALNLSVIPDEEVGGPPGHALIPELSWAAYQQNRQRSKEVLVELAQLASQSIAYEPPG